MSSVHGVIRSALGRNKVCRNMYDKIVKERVPSQELYLLYSSYFAQEGKLRESLDMLYYAIKNSENHLTNDKILPILSIIVQHLRHETKETQICSHRNEFSCPMCLGVLHEPITLPCGHTYCRRCTLRNIKFCLVCQAQIPSLEKCDIQCNVLISSLVNKWWKNEVLGVKLRTKGNRHLEEKNLTEAIDIYTEAVNKAPNDHLLLSNRSRAYLSLGRAEDALKDANDAIHRRPNWAKGHFRQASALLSVGREEEALVAMLVCASLENSNDLDSILKEIARILLVIMSRFSFRPSSEGLGKHAAAFALLDEGAKGLRDPPAEEVKCGVEGLRKRRLSGSTTTGYDVIVEEIPIVDKLLKKFEVEMEKIKNDGTGYSRSVDPANVQKSDFECSLCYHYLWEPVTTPCGHTFCRSCLDRCLDHAIHCPLCKTSLREYLAENRSSITEFVEVAMKTHIPNEYRERGLQHEHEMSEYAKAGKDLQHEIPIFVATLAIPSIACPLHVFEPRYRLLIRRVMEAGTREFGMCMPSETDENGFSNYGTMLEVREVKPLTDGRRIVNAVGSRRFKCISKGVKDGYNTATVQYLQDIPVCSETLEELQQLHNSVNQKAKQWFDSLDRPTKSRIMDHYGPMPAIENSYWTLSDGPVWIWWLIAVLPLESRVQMRIMKECSLKTRLQLVWQILKIVVLHQSRGD